MSILKRVKNVDLRVDMATIKSMNKLFADYKKLQVLKLIAVNTESIQSMDRTFSGCVRLESVDFVNFDTSNVVSMFQMFYDCKKLKTIDLSSWDTRKVCNYKETFKGCDSLQRVYLGAHSLNLLSEETGAKNIKFYVPKECLKDTQEYKLGEGCSIVNS